MPRFIDASERVKRTLRERELETQVAVTHDLALTLENCSD